MILPVWVVVLSPVVLALFDVNQVYVEPTLLVRFKLIPLPLQIAKEVVLVITGVGLTVMGTTIGVPVQPPAFGVTV
jgi:hypothetical protein